MIPDEDAPIGAWLEACQAQMRAKEAGTRKAWREAATAWERLAAATTGPRDRAVFQHMARDARIKCSVWGRISQRLLAHCPGSATLMAETGADHEQPVPHRTDR